MKTNFNKILYIGFVIIATYNVFLNHDFSGAAMNLGIALAFDPFNQEVSWNDRPIWQKVVLITHLALVAALIGYEIGFNDK